MLNRYDLADSAGIRAEALEAAGHAATQRAADVFTSDKSVRQRQLSVQQRMEEPNYNAERRLSQRKFAEQALHKPQEIDTPENIVKRLFANSDSRGALQTAAFVHLDRVLDRSHLGKLTDFVLANPNTWLATGFAMNTNLPSLAADKLPKVLDAVTQKPYTRLAEGFGLNPDFSHIAWAREEEIIKAARNNLGSRLANALDSNGRVDPFWKAVGREVKEVLH